MKIRPEVIAVMLGMAPMAAADAPRGSSYADDATAADAAPVEVRTLIGEAPVDLHVKRLPPRLKMRSAHPAKAKSVAQAAKADAAADASTSVSFKAFPTTARDLKERVTFRIRSGVEIDTAPANGDTQRGGFELPGDFAETRPFIRGDAVVGARGIITPSLNGYFLTSFAFDASQSNAAESAVILPYDNQELVIKAGYAEWGRDDRKPDDRQPSNVWLRGGRQFRLDGGNLFAYFDGATVGFKKGDVSASAFGGQRVALFVDTEPGIVFGATAGAKLGSLKTRFALDYMGLAIASTDFDGDGENDNETRHLMAVTSSTELSRTMKLDAHVRLTGLADIENTEAGEVPGTKFALGRVGARLRYEGRRLVVLVDAEQRTADDVAYDLAAPAAVDVLQIADKVGILAKPVDSTAVGVRADWQNKKRNAELIAFARTEFANDTPVFTDQRSYVEGGAGFAGSPIGVRGAGVWMTAQYTYRQYTNEGVDGDMRIDGACNDLTDADMDGIPDACLSFDDTSSSGLDRMHQLAAEATLATRSSNGKRWRFGAGAFFRVYDFSSPYREVTNDARGGGRVDLQYWLNRDLHIDFAGEVAQASPTLAREIGLMSALRAAVEARW